MIIDKIAKMATKRIKASTALALSNSEDSQTARIM
jgi:hypothetical protein